MGYILRTKHPNKKADAKTVIFIILSSNSTIDGRFTSLKMAKENPLQCDQRIRDIQVKKDVVRAFVWE